MVAIFRMDKEGKLFLHKDAIKLIPEIDAVNQKELKYIILAYDYIHSPFRMKPPEERKMIAGRQVWGVDKKNIETPKVKDAIEAYVSLIYDPKRASIDVFKNKKEKIERDLRTLDLDFKTTNEYVKMIDLFSDRIEKLEEDVVREEETIKLKGDTSLSFLEKWQRNRKKFLEQNNQY